MLWYPGKANVEIVIYDTSEKNKRLSTMCFNLIIEAAVYSEDRVIASDEFNALTELINKVNKDYDYVITECNKSASNAKTSATNASKSEVNAKTYMNNANTYKNNAATSATNSANSAKLSQSWAVGGTSSRDGEDTNNSKYYATQSANSASASKTSETNAKSSETKAKTSETNASNSASSASTSATNASNSASSASTSADIATTKASEASTSATNASKSEVNAKTYMNNASSSATSANTSAETATTKASEASTSASNAKTYATNASNSATTSQNYAIGNTNSAKYYYEQAKMISESFSGALKPMGTVTFTNLPPLSEASDGDMYNISDQFTTTDDFREGSGFVIPIGSNVYKTSDGKWDVLAGTPVTGVKGNSESSYRTGNINLTANDIGAATASHTHNYAGSSSAGGSATSAKKLNVSDTGSSTNPVYFKNGIPVKCDDLNAVSEAGAHGIRYYNGKLAVKDSEGNWKEIKTGGGGSSFAPKATVDPAIKSANGKVTITWGDPDNVTVEGVTLSKWAGTQLRMSTSGYPTSENEGTLVIDNTTKDAYKTSGYVVDGLTNGTKYYFALFPYSTDGVFNTDESNRLLGSPSLAKLDACTNMALVLSDKKVSVTWTDPDATKTENDITATWAKTVLVYKEGTAAPTSTSDGTVAVEETTQNTYQATGCDVTVKNGKTYTFALFAVSTEGSESDSTNAQAKMYATISITTDESSLYNQTVSVTDGTTTKTATFTSTGNASVDVPWFGETTITSTDGTDTATSTITVSAFDTTYSVELSFIKIVTFADGTDEEIVAMIEAHYADKINLSDYWAVGDKRTVTLSAMSATYVGESHSSQDVQLTIIDFDHDDLVTPINGKTKAAISVQLKNCLNTKGYMNSSNTNVGGWEESTRRKWCNDIFYNAIPSILRNGIKQVIKKNYKVYNSNNITTTSDYCFLLSETEIFVFLLAFAEKRSV